MGSSISWGRPYHPISRVEYNNIFETTEELIIGDIPISPRYLHIPILDDFLRIFRW